VVGIVVLALGAVVLLALATRSVRRSGDGDTPQVTVRTSD
jgi:hypothetical protein